MARPKKKHAGGRPRKIDEKVVKKLIDAFKDDFTIGEACRFAGISTQTYYEECKRNTPFADEMDRAQDYPLALAKKRMMAYIKSPRDGFGALALKFLERRHRERYTPKVTVEHEGGLMTYTDLESQPPKAKSPDEARKIAEEQSNA